MPWIYNLMCVLALSIQKRAYQTLIWQHIRASIWYINHPGICSKFIKIMLTTVYHGNRIFHQNSIRLILSTTCHWRNCHQKVNNHKKTKILKVWRKWHIHHWLRFRGINNNWRNMTPWRKLTLRTVTMVHVCKVIVQCQREFALPFASSYCEGFNSVRLVQACSSASPTAALQIHTSHLQPALLLTHILLIPKLSWTLSEIQSSVHTRLPARVVLKSAESQSNTSH